MERRLERAVTALAGLRIFVGILWLANLSWKLPPDFGRDDPRGLLYSFRQGEQHALVEPLRHFMRSVVIPHFTLFGSLVFTVELLAGSTLLLGLFTRYGALIGTAQSLAITVLVVRAPNEWFWGYAMLVLLNLLPLVAPSSARLSLDHRLGRS